MTLRSFTAANPAAAAALFLLLISILTWSSCLASPLDQPDTAVRFNWIVIRPVYTKLNFIMRGRRNWPNRNWRRKFTRKKAVIEWLALRPLRPERVGPFYLTAGSKQLSTPAHRRATAPSSSTTKPRVLLTNEIRLLMLRSTSTRRNNIYNPLRKFFSSVQQPTRLG